MLFRIKWSRKKRPHFRICLIPFSRLVCRTDVHGPAVSGARKLMIQRSAHHRPLWLAKAGSAAIRLRVCLSLAFFLAMGGLWCRATDQMAKPTGQSADSGSRHFVTNTAQFRTVTGTGYLEGCDFHLDGVVTLIDSDRNLAVLQDEAGAVAIHFPWRGFGPRFGQHVSLEGSNCCPYIAQFPDYPYHPALREIQNTFEAPTGCGDYYLTRMRGCLHPPVAGEYTFWIASDNSSELWLSTDASPAEARKIAFIPRFSWVAPHDWTRFSSQRSGPVWLEAGKAYYVEAIQEQTTVGDNLAVAWQGPGLKQSVIDGRYLTPGVPGGGDWATNGILREFWTNYTAGDLNLVSGPRPFQSALSVEKLGMRVLEQKELPKPVSIFPGQAWLAENNYRWGTTEGLVKFIGAQEKDVCFELGGDVKQIQVRVPHLDASFLEKMHKARVRVEGTCEGIYDREGNLVPGIIWVSGEDHIHLVQSGRTNVDGFAVENANGASVAQTNLGLQGFYSAHGVVTFNDRVLGKDYLVVQEEDEAMLVSGGETSFFQKQLKVGEWLELGGALSRDKVLPVSAPLVITELGWHSMPAPMPESLVFSSAANRAGKWSEIEGVVHSANPNGTLHVISKGGPVYFWVSQASTNALARYVDAKLRVRGVLLPNTLEAPLVLIPSPNYVEVEEAAPVAPFDVPQRSIAELSPEGLGFSWAHRARVAGEITYRDAQSFFIQDNSGGIRVVANDRTGARVGDTVEVVGFPGLNGATRSLTEVLIRPTKTRYHIQPKVLDLNEALSSKQNGTLVLANATLLAHKTNGLNQTLELQEQQRIFTATLPADQASLRDIPPGSRLQVTGVCNNEMSAASMTGDQPVMARNLASLNVWLRSAADVTVLKGPPWWTWRRAVLLVGTLLAVIAVILLWVHLLRRRLERQHAAQLAFSRQVLERLEDERRRIAVNLHDSLGQILLAIKNQALLAIQRPSDETGTKQRLDEISGATSQAIEEVRQITHGLRPYQLERLGLAQAIRASVSRASANSPISFAVRVEEIDGLFDKDAEIHVYRIVQEAVTNVVKHSAATEAAVVIKKRTTTISLSVRDNGRGLDPAAPFSTGQGLGSGLSGIAERVRILGGTYAFESRPGEGTSLTVEFPLSEPKHETRHFSVDRG